MEFEEDVKIPVDMELVEELYADGLMYASSHNNMILYYNSLSSAAKLIADDMKVNVDVPYMGFPNVLH